MKKILLLVVVALVNVTTLKAQNDACPGLKNPVSFGMYSNYSGQTGSREDGTSSYQTQYLQMTSSVPIYAISYSYRGVKSLLYYR